MIVFLVTISWLLMFSSNHVVITLKCLSDGTPITINFLFVSNGKLMILRCLNIQAQ